MKSPAMARPFCQPAMRRPAAKYAADPVERFEAQKVMPKVTAINTRKNITEVDMLTYPRSAVPLA